MPRRPRWADVCGSMPSPHLLPWNSRLNQICSLSIGKKTAAGIIESRQRDVCHRPYDDDLIARAVRDGLNPADEELSSAMPRWDLTDAEIADLIDYLKTLSEENTQG